VGWGHLWGAGLSWGFSVPISEGGGTQGSLLLFFLIKKNFFLAAPHGKRDLISLTRDRTCAFCSGSALQC